MGNSTPSQFRLQRIANTRTPSSSSALPSAMTTPNHTQCPQSPRNPVHSLHSPQIIPRQTFSSSRRNPGRIPLVSNQSHRDLPQPPNRPSAGSDSASSGSILSKERSVHHGVDTHDFLKSSTGLPEEELDEINPDDFINSDSDEQSGSYANQISNNLLTKSLPRLQEDIEALVSEVSRQISEVSKAREKRASCEQQLDSLRLSFEENQELKRSADQRVIRAAQENALLSNTCKQLREKIESLGRSADMDKLKHEELQSAFQDEIHELTATTSEKDTLLSTKDDEIRKVQKELSYAQGQFEAEVVKRESLAQEKTKLDKQIADLNKQVENLREAVATEEKHSACVVEKQGGIIAALEQDKSQQDAKVAGLESSIRDMATENLRLKRITSDTANGLREIRGIQNEYILSVRGDHSSAGLDGLFGQVEKSSSIPTDDHDKGDQSTPPDAADGSEIRNQLNSIKESLQELLLNSALREQILIECISAKEANSGELLSSLQTTVELSKEPMVLELEVQKALNEAHEQLGKLREGLGKTREQWSKEHQSQKEAVENQKKESERLQKEVESHCHALDKAKARLGAVEEQKQAFSAELESCKRARERDLQELKDSQTSLRVTCSTREKMEEKLCAAELEKGRMRNELEECRREAKNAKDEVLYVTEMVHRSTMEAEKEKKELLSKVETVKKDLAGSEMQRAVLEQTMVRNKGLIAELEVKLEEARVRKGFGSTETPTSDAKPRTPSKDHRKGPTGHLAGNQDGWDTVAGQKQALPSTDGREGVLDNMAMWTKKRQQTRSSQRMRSAKRARAKSEVRNGGGGGQEKGRASASMGSHDGDDEDWILNESILGLGPSN